MAFTIRANHKTYAVTVHAARRMNKWDINEQEIVDTMESGSFTEQPHGNDLYEKEFASTTAALKVVQVIVDEENRTIVSVIDVSD